MVIGPIGYKNYDNYCLKCSRPNCAEAKMPKMIIKQLDKYKTGFSLEPNKPLQKNILDWAKRIRANVDGLLKDKDYKLNIDVKKGNKVRINFDGFKNFDSKKLVVEVFNVKGIYDLEGNMMHENKAEIGRAHV